MDKKTKITIIGAGATVLKVIWDILKKLPR